jgi:hypothetical protein
MPTQGVTIHDFTIFRTTCVGLVDAQYNKVGTQQVQEHFYAQAVDAENALGEILVGFAEADPRLDDIASGDDEFEAEFSIALDDVAGEFTVYAGLLDAKPSTKPLHEEGEVGEPVLFKRDYNLTPQGETTGLPLTASTVSLSVCLSGR